MVQPMQGPMQYMRDGEKASMAGTGKQGAGEEVRTERGVFGGGRLC